MKRSPLKRKTPIARGPGPKRTGGLRRGKRLRTRNHERVKAASARNFGAEAEAVRAMACLCIEQDPDLFFWQLEAAHSAGQPESFVICRGSVQAAHVTARGMGASKGGRFDIVPLCDAHHREAGEDRTSQRRVFEACYGLDLRRIADRIAVHHPLPLGIRGLAFRFLSSGQVSTATGRHHEKDLRRFAELGLAKSDGNGFWLVKQLDGYERSALLWWTRRHVEAYISSSDEPRRWETAADRLGEALGFDKDDGWSAWAIGSAAVEGWDT